MNFQVELKNNNSVFTIYDTSIEGKAASELKSRLIVAAQPDIKSLIIDLSNVSVIDSSGLGALLLAYRQLRPHSIPIVLIGVQDFVRSLLDITHIDELFNYKDDVDSAISDN